MAKFLWACWDGGGNLTPSLGIAHALKKRGHNVVFAGRAAMRARVEAAGITMRELTQAYTLLNRFDWQPQAQVPIFAYLASTAVGEELVSLVHDEAPDVVIIDAMFSAALDVAPRFAVPTAVMVHTFARRTAPMWTMILKRQGEMRERAGLSGLPDISVLWGERDLVHSNSLAAFDNGALPITNLGTADLSWSRSSRATVSSLPWQDDDPTPLVLLSFSTVTEQRAPALLQRALDALEPLPVRVVATTGAIVDPDDLRPPANAVVLRFASHDALMPRAALVLTHGGHGTAMRSLRHGVPTVFVTGAGGDQPFVAGFVQESGAGRALPNDATAADIRGTVETVMGDPSYASRAVALGTPLADLDGATLAANSVEGLLARASHHADAPRRI